VCNFTMKLETMSRFKMPSSAAYRRLSKGVEGGVSAGQDYTRGVLKSRVGLKAMTYPDQYELLCSRSCRSIFVCDKGLRRPASVLT
jgi:hypothetical protein